MESKPNDGIYYIFKDRETGLNKKLQIFSKLVEGTNQDPKVSTPLVMTTIRDMSFWLELERQKTISSLKTIAFASAAHEFRNPLNGILSSLQLLKDKIDLKTGSLYYTTAMDCTNLMLYLVKDILDFSQIESKSFILNHSVCNVVQVLEECISIFKLKAV